MAGKKKKLNQILLRKLRHTNNKKKMLWNSLRPIKNHKLIN
jgi:hypothetical protein